VTTGEIYQRPGRAVAVFPTNDDLTMVYVSGPLADFERFRRDIKGSFLATLDRCGDLGERVRGGRLAERLRTTPDQPNLFRAASGPGWALVGDAGVVMDSITAQGITNALRDADRLATAVVAGLGGEPLGSGPASAGPPDPGFAGARALGSALAGHGRRRDRDIRAMFDFTVDIAGFRPLTALQRQLFASLAGRPAEIDRFLGAFAGITPVDEYFSTGNAARLIGPRGLLRAATTWVHGAAVPMPRTA
jgi:flavin-dependent dehydrogenase